MKKEKHSNNKGITLIIDHTLSCDLDSKNDIFRSMDEVKSVESKPFIFRIVTKSFFY